MIETSHFFIDSINFSQLFISVEIFAKTRSVIRSQASLSSY